jgi:hypothetical protein
MQDIWLEGDPRKNMDFDGFLQMMEDNAHNFLRFWQWMQGKDASWNPSDRCSGELKKLKYNVYLSLIYVY